MRARRERTSAPSPRSLISSSSALPSNSPRHRLPVPGSRLPAGNWQPAIGNMNWLGSLPHQIPFRAASAARRIDNKTIEGTFLCTANETLPVEIMVAEAMAQLAGGLAFHDTHGPGFLTGIDGCEIDRPIEVGDVVTFVVTL